MGLLKLASPWPQVVSVLHYFRVRPSYYFSYNQFETITSLYNSLLFIQILLTD